MSLKLNLRVSQQKVELAYSLFLMLLIPTCIVGLTLWLTSHVKTDFDQELRRKANLANEVFGVSVAGILTTASPEQAPAKLQNQIDQARAQAPEIDQLSVSIQQGSGFQTIASSDPAKPGQPDTSIQTQLAWSKNQAVASLIGAGEGQDREWLVATPITSSTGNPLAVTTMRVSLASADALIATTLRNAFIILGVMLVVIILLLLNHFRFVEYAELFRKQKELDQMKDDFISIATHELKAPMSVIKGYISMALDDKRLSQDAADMMHIAYDQTDRLNHLVTDLLDVSRLEQGRTKYTLKPVELPATLRPMIDTTFKQKAADKHLALHYQPPANLPPVSADPDRVSEIFTNLIDNAIKYSRTGTVSVLHTVTPAAVITTVQDTGIGMTPDEQARLFQRFYRARNADTQDIAGTGLGLWIIKQYVEHMGGTIQVDSEKGVGSKFIVTLPRTIKTAPETD
jgi:signal transduction histidine kinase